MVVLFFSTSSNKSLNISTKEYADQMKKGVIRDDANRCIGIELSSMKDLQLSNLDTMLKTSDELIKSQNDFEGFLKNLEKKLQDLQSDYKLIVNLKNKPHKVKDAIVAFSWDDQKYPRKGKTVENIMDKLTDKLTTTRNNFKTKSDEYYEEVEKLKQKQKSDVEARAYMKKDYREILKNKTDLMTKSKFLTSLLVFVPTNMIDTFREKYQSIVKDCVVPNSGYQLCNNEDEKTTLWRVVLMKNKLNDYVNELRRVVKANSKEYDEKEITILPTLLMEQKVIEANIEDKRSNLIQSMQSYFSEVYHATLHLMYLRLYTEATLKYGSASYHSLIIIPEEGKEARIISNILKKETDGHPGWYGTKEELKDSDDFFPFIMLKLGVPLHLKDQ